ncbi:hypothetical protein [uncultured Porphyromonas sp.]|uniref:hypothetical protein n=1 Tax=uncultured Porphyromonas sp. TaxID=159274 RepID=UPI0026123AB9|nr:hypothetical protein [uncultured Porphyromonas sp.]
MSKHQTRTELEARTEESPQTLMRVNQETFVDTGLLPSAKELKEYQDLDPRFIDFFLETARREQDARISQNDRILGLAEEKEKKVSTDRRIGMGLAFILFLLVLGLVAYALYLGSPWIAGVLATLSVGGVIQAFTNAHRSKES